MEFGVLLRLGWVESGAELCAYRGRMSRTGASHAGVDPAHQLACASCGGWISRHNQLRDACVHMARKAGFAVYKEPRGGHEAFRAQEGGDMLVLGAGDHGRHLMSDVVISNPLAQTHVTGAAAADQFANEAAAKRKVGRYQVQAHQADWELLPLPFEVFGAMGK